MFSLKFGSAVGAAVPGFMLAAYGFVANQAQTPQAMEGIQIMFSLVPATCYVAAGVVILFYRLTRELMQTIESDLYERRLATEQV